MSVVAGDSVSTCGGGQWDQVERVERSQPRQIEHGTKVDEEGVIALAGEYLDSVWQAGDRGIGERVVVIGRPRPDVVGRRRNVVAEQLRPLRVSRTMFDEGDAVG